MADRLPSPNLSQRERRKKIFVKIPIFSPLSFGRGAGGEGLYSQ